MRDPGCGLIDQKQERGESEGSEVVRCELALEAVGGELAGGDCHHAGVVDEEVEAVAGKHMTNYALGEGVDGARASARSRTWRG